MLATVWHQYRRFVGGRSQLLWRLVQCRWEHCVHVSTAKPALPARPDSSELKGKDDVSATYSSCTGSTATVRTAQYACAAALQHRARDTDGSGMTTDVLTTLTLCGIGIVQVTTLRPTWRRQDATANTTHASHAFSRVSRTVRLWQQHTANACALVSGFQQGMLCSTMHMQSCRTFATGCVCLYFAENSLTVFCSTSMQDRYSRDRPSVLLDPPLSGCLAYTETWL